MTEYRALQIMAEAYSKELLKCDDLLTEHGIPEWVENLDNNGVPSNTVAERLKWYLLRRKDVKPKEAEPELQAEIRKAVAHASEHDNL